MNTLFSSLGRLIDRLPMVWVAVLAIWLAAAPMIPEPHLLEKWRMLLQGTLTRPLDVFDFFLHTVPLLVLLIKLGRAWAARSGPADSPAPPAPPPPPH